MIQLHPIALEVIANGGFPTKHLSYSSIKEYLSNPRSFLKKYIRYEFDDSTKGTFMVGKSVHKALEIVFSRYKETGEFMTYVDAVQEWYNHFNREIKESQCKALAKWVQDQGGSAEFPIFTKEIETADIEKFYEDFCLQAREFIILPEDLGEKTPEEELAWIDGYIKDNIENTLITLRSGASFDSMIQESKDEIAIALENFYALGDSMIPAISIHSTEKEEKVFFLDENGDEMPIALKAISDRIDEDEKSCEITDYKTVAKFSETDAEKADYEMQAGANYFTALVATGKVPKKMLFVEILKKAPGYILEEDPDRRLLKDDLIELVKTRLGEDKLGAKETVDSLRTKLIEGGVLVQEKGVNVFEIDFEQRPDVVATFLSLYKGVVNMIALSELCGVYLPNIGAQWGGLEAYQDFKEFDAVSKAPAIKKLESDTIVEEEIEML